MAHPDDGYMIPDEEWNGMVNPETGENFYTEDRFAGYRNLLIQIQQDEARGVVRADQQQRLERLRRLREEALNGRVDSEIEDAE
jgi:hypothetical protein